MASPSQREDEMPNLPSQPPHFFKIILPETLVQEKLKIPKKFVRRYGETLADSVLLEVPSGRVWQIDLIRHVNGEVWLENGWKPFVGCYSLRPGHLVAFRYEGNSKFSVFIYDVSTSEIDYRPNERLNKPKNDVPFENLDDFCPQTPLQKKKRADLMSKTNNGTHTLPSQDFDQATRSDGTSKLSQDLTNVADEDIQNRTMDLETVNVRTRRQGLKPNTYVDKRALNLEERATKLQKANEFKSERPFFIVVMQRSYIQKGSKLCIPAKFMKTHFAHDHGDVILLTSDGRTWPAKFNFQVSHKKRSAKLYAGWRIFAEEHGLKVGDVCVFELQEGAKAIFRVLIF